MLTLDIWSVAMTDAMRPESGSSKPAGQVGPAARPQQS